MTIAFIAVILFLPTHTGGLISKETFYAYHQQEVCGGATDKAAKPQAQPAKKPWYVRGDATADAVAKEDHRIEEEQSQRGKLFRFWLEKGGEGAITFIDGTLTEKGVLDSFMFREHSLFMNGKWGNIFVCTAEQEPCPICEGGDQPSLVGCFTVIDHRSTPAKKATPTKTPGNYSSRKGTR